MDDFLIAVERQLDTTATTMDLRDVARLHDHGSSGILVGMEMVKIDGSFAMRRLPAHVVKSETKESDDNELLRTWEHLHVSTATGDRTCSTQSTKFVARLPHRHAWIVDD